MTFNKEDLHNFRLYTRAIIFDGTRERVLLLKKRANQEIGSDAWLFPGGAVEFSEDVERALIREIQEETNLQICSLELLTIKKMILQETHWLGVYFLAEVVNEGALQNKEQMKHEVAEFVPLTAIPPLEDDAILQLAKHKRAKK